MKEFNSMKGFGFISRDDGQPDAFVHISAVERAGLPTINEARYPDRGMPASHKVSGAFGREPGGPSKRD